ncbi:MAG TPA: hypothetical protein VD793_10460, partial [Gemmatimonadales bacterium]|nr:hypothetical protein [Gemmatimonadales bacterium]
DWFEVPPEGRSAPGLGQFSVLMPPGTYTVKLMVGGQEFSQPLEVRKDPNSGGSLEEVRTQVARLHDLQGDMNAAVDLYNQAEMIRVQLQGLQRALGTDGSVAADVRAAADSLERKTIALEEQLHQLRVTNRGQDGIRWPVRLIGQINYLSNGMGSSDFAPTTQQVQVHELLKSQVRALQGQMRQLVERDVAAFNQLLRQRNVAGVVTTVREPGVP